MAIVLRMNYVFKLAKSSGESVVLGKTNGRQVRFSAAAFKLGYAAASLKRDVLGAANFLARESAAVSANLYFGITVEKLA